MRTEKEKMLAGELYDASDPRLTLERQQCRERCRAYSAATNADERQLILSELFGKETTPHIEAPFYCDYGSNIDLGENVYFNFNCVILDVMKVSIGDNSLFGPAVQIYTATHPIDAAERRSGFEFARPISIGSDVWIGGGAILCPGVTIGDRAVIGAGSVVTHDIQAETVVAGNPAKIIRHL
ncbi:MAG: maltose O-acetyltransferase [Verrucomicrobiales bacterium]|jgi:maltose O-acetyltransferase